MHRPLEEDGKLQVLAGQGLLEISRLVAWSAARHEFIPTSREAFESAWQSEVHETFGRLSCWINFSAGCEFLLKGVCLLRGLEFRSNKTVSCYPVSDLPSWPARYKANWKSDGTIEVSTYGVLGDFTWEQNGVSRLVELCSIVSASQSESDLLVSSFKLLQRSIRNRDAHAYIPNVRDSHHNLVPELFSESLNLLSSWIPGGAPQLTQWRADAKSFVASK